MSAALSEKIASPWAIQVCSLKRSWRKANIKAFAAGKAIEIGIGEDLAGRGGRCSQVHPSLFDGEAVALA
jgi:hypothetical protein